MTLGPHFTPSDKLWKNKSCGDREGLSQRARLLYEKRCTLETAYREARKELLPGEIPSLLETHR